MMQQNTFFVIPEAYVCLQESVVVVKMYSIEIVPQVFIWMLIA